MRFIVDMYRYILLALVAVTIILVVFIGLMLVVGSEEFSDSGPVFIFGAIAFLVLEIMALGIAATFISIHDRHVELVEELREIRLVHASNTEREKLDE